MARNLCRYATVVVLVMSASIGQGVLGRDEAAATGEWPYVWPVNAPIIDSFRAPANPYGPGNRGIEFATSPGQTVVAAANGTVVFAGQVAGRLFVTITHPDGVRTSYSFLRTIGVSRGQVVLRGEPIATTGVVFHVGARIGAAYIDPAVLFGGAPTRAHLIDRTEPLPGDLRARVLLPGRPSLFILGSLGAVALPRLVIEPLQSRSDTDSGVRNTHPPLEPTHGRR